MSLMNEMEAESLKEENENSDAANDHSESSGKSDSSDSNDEKKRKKMITKGKKPVVEKKKQQQKKKNTTNEVNAVKLMTDAISSIDKEPPRILVKKKSSKKNKILQSPIRRSTRLSSGRSESVGSLNTTDKCLAKIKKPKESKKVRFGNDEILVEEDDAMVHTDVVMVHTHAAMVHTDAVTGEDKAAMEKPKEKVRINFTPPSFNLQLYVAEKGKSKAGQYDSEAVKVDSKVVNVSSVGPNVSYKAGHVTYEGNNEPIKLPSYVVKGEGSTDYPTMRKVKEELYEA
ncbi:hypothetical protein ZOSMA_12G00760 [Zostera marina]|uniref:Uncharacterized protein n=1 Tax=Zostera marina TaxID=29655 RepID=A0A0K9Q1Q1_ZOSMR|nr:hypothetical protein ZOSMA_12G00760 [Zostera marina]